MRSCDNCQTGKSGNTSDGWTEYRVGEPTSPKQFILCGRCEDNPEVEPRDFTDTNGLLFGVAL